MSKISKRWPIHPLPYTDESLLSWITRIAKIYNFYPEDLLKYEFDIEIEANNLYIIDINPPINLLDKLSQLTGVDVDKIRALTAHSYVPLLIDDVVPLNGGSEGNPNSFNDYVNQFNVFPHKRNDFSENTIDHAMDNKWIPWVDSKYFVNTIGCETCLEGDKEPYLRLYWRFPWMMTCPIHKQLLKQVRLYNFTNHIEFYFKKDAEKLPYSIDNLCIMDEITLQAVTTGYVKTPAGCMHGGVWLRLLRSLIEELSLLQKNFSNEVLNVIRSFWKELGLCYRDGFYRYKVFEGCDYDQQLKLMLVASSVIQSIFNRQIKFSTNGIKLLTPEPISTKDLCSVYLGYIVHPFVKPVFLNDPIFL